MERSRDIRRQPGRRSRARTRGIQILVAAAVAVACSEAPTPSSEATESSPAESSEATFEAPARIVIITIDTLRADHLPFYGYPVDTAPFLSRLARRGMVFEHAFATSSHTGPSHSSIFTSLYPAEHGVLRNGEPLEEGVTTLATDLQALGYRTIGTPAVGFLDGLQPGFEFYEPSPRKHELASQVVGRALDWTAKLPSDARFFLWVHLYDVHSWASSYPRYGPAEGLVARATEDAAVLEQALREEHGLQPDAFGDMDWREAIRRYDGRIRFVDMQIRRLYSKLEGGRFDGNSVWVVTSDHGEGLGTNAHLGHGRHIYGAQLHVPLLFHFSDDRHLPRRITQLVRHVDIYPTLLDLAGGRPPEGIRGQSLVPLLAGQSEGFPALHAFAERRPADEERRASRGWRPGTVHSLQTLDVKLIRRSEADDSLFELATDPREETNRIADETLAARRDELEAELEELARSGAIREPKDSRVGAEHEEELRALGYIE